MRLHGTVLLCACLIAAGSSLFWVGCGGQPARSAEIEQEYHLVWPAGKPAPVAETTQNGILLRISTDKTVYEPGEKVLITAYAQNVSSELIQFEYSAAGQIVIGVSGAGSQGPRYVMIDDQGRKFTVIIMLAYGATLVPGESITRETYWDQKYLGDDFSEFDALRGEHEVSVRFASPGAEQWPSVSVNVQAGA